MDVRKYKMKQMDKTMELNRVTPTNDIEKAIIDLEQIICSIQPYSRWWRWGYIKSIRMAIKALKINNALEKAFKARLFIGYHASVTEDDVPYLPKFYSIKDLIKWAESEGK